MGQPGIVVTGASGFIGRHFVIAVSRQFRLFCLARRTQKEAGVPKDENIHWVQVDISNRKDLQDISKYVIDRGGADYVLHLAGYYDFSQEENPAYEMTNVVGTSNVLELAETLRARRFLFSSSLAACKFPARDQMVTEESPADADFPYAISKRKGEDIIREYSNRLPSTIIRLAAVFSDWCEYPPLYMLLKAWLSRRRLMSRV
ncbi:MAG: NAD-dependent epimerase/dehydratase family protein, partial [Thermodesulfobacteriota bacterium]|nr:NAD-dependent epimerase/dehydratase family protein [Thermodesulfobacteriota bacterium]